MKRIMFLVTVGLIVPMAHAAEITFVNKTEIKPENLLIERQEQEGPFLLPLSSTRLSDEKEKMTTTATRFRIQETSEMSYPYPPSQWIDVIDNATYTIRIGFDISIEEAELTPERSKVGRKKAEFTPEKKKARRQ